MSKSTANINSNSIFADLWLVFVCTFVVNLKLLEVENVT